MTTRDPRPPHSPDDDRDPRVATWLAVEPLDEVTRRRLVAGALAGVDVHTPRARRRPGPVLAIAAAVLVALVVGLAVLVPRGGDSRPVASGEPASRRAAESASTPESAPESAAESAPESTAADAGLAAPLVLPSIGDLGDVSTERRLERAARARLARPYASTPVTVTGCAAAAGRAFGTPIAAGTGRIDGRRALVVVAEQPSGSSAVVAVQGRTCERAVSVLLP